MKTSIKSLISLLVFLLFVLLVNAQTISFSESGDTLFLTNSSYYEVGILKTNGSISHVTEQSSGDTVFLGSSKNDLWTIGFDNDSTLRASRFAGTFSYQWDNTNHNLILTYSEPDSVSVVVTITASLDRYFDMQLSFNNQSHTTISSVNFPYTLKINETKITQGLFPDKPGLLLSADFFTNLSNNPDGISAAHPPAMADYLGLQTAHTTVALYSKWGPGPVRVNFLGFEHLQGTTGGATHGFNVWRQAGFSWASPPVRIRFANSFEETVRAYRMDNEIDKFESLRDKLGAKYNKIVSSPYVGMSGDWFGPYSGWYKIIKKIPSPAILYINDFWEGNFHGHFPDVIPPDHQYGTTADFKAALDSAHQYGLLTMPMILPTWWHEKSPTVLNLGNYGLTIDSIAMIEKDGNLQYICWELGGQKDYGYNISPRVPFVLQRLDKLMHTLNHDMEFDMIYEDVLGSMSYGPDINTHAPDTIDSEGWLNHTRTYKNNLLVTESGSDYFAQFESGFLGGGHGPTWDEYVPNTEAWPMSAFLYKDKVMHYQYWGSNVATISKSALGWNLAYGYMLNISIVPGSKEETPGSDWFRVVNKFHTKIIRRYADQLLHSYTRLSPDNAIRCEYDSMTIIANRDSVTALSYGRYELSPQGCLAFTPDEKLVGGIFIEFNNKKLEGKDQFLIVQKYQDSIEVDHPMGETTPLTLMMLPNWDENDTLWAKVYNEKGILIDVLQVNNDTTSCTFNCLKQVQGQVADHFMIVRSGEKPATSWKIFFNDHNQGYYLLGNKNYYEIRINDLNTAIKFIIDKTSGDTISEGSEWDIPWSVEFPDAPDNYKRLSPIDGIDTTLALRPYNLDTKWSEKDSTLTFTYFADSTPNIRATISITISENNYFDIQLHVENRWGYTAKRISFPNKLVFKTDATTTALLPFSYPGIRLKPSFFINRKGFEASYPDQFKSDFFALQQNNGNLALYSLWKNDSVRTTQLGLLFSHDPDFYYYRHEFPVWLKSGEDWTSPVMRFRIGATPVECLKAFRSDQNIDGTATALENRTNLAEFNQVAKSPVFYSAFGESTSLPFNTYAAWASHLPSPSLMILSDFYPGGQYGSHPDVVPPDATQGSESEFRTMIAELHHQGKMIVPYTIPGWWNENSATVKGLSGSPDLNDLAVIQADSNPAYVTYNGRDYGYLVSAYPDFVKQKIASNYNKLKRTYGFDFIFEDKISSIPVEVDFNSSAPNQNEYHQGWLEHAATNRDSLIMVNSGYDRLLMNAVGNKSTLYFDPDKGPSQLDYDIGDDNWEYFPVAPLMVHDKVIPFQAEDQSTTNKNILSWNMLYGCNLSYKPDENDPEMTWANPWVKVIQVFQSKALSQIAGKAMTAYSEPDPGVVKSIFEDIQVVKNENSSSGYKYDDYTIAPEGAFLSSANGKLIAGIFTAYNNQALSSGDHYLVVQKTSKEQRVYHPMGSETSISLTRPAAWTNSDKIHTEAITAKGSAQLARTVSSDSIQFTMPMSIAGDTVSYFRIYYTGACFSKDTVAVICPDDSLLWRGSYFTAQGTYFDSLLTHSGCDSIYALQLSYYSLTPLVLGNDTTINLSDSLVLDTGNSFNIYQWSNGTNQPTLTFYAKDAGTGDSTIWVRVSDTNSCIQTDTITIVVSTNTGLALNDRNNFNIRIFPNPTSGRLIINTQNLDKNIVIELLSLNGTRIYNYVIAPNTVEKLDVSYLKKAFYLLKIKYKNKISIYKLIIK